ncbi:MAG: hypothetical protein ACOX3R_11050 [Desulfitobacteriia bacterium]|jgi:hypothetical protein
MPSKFSQFAQSTKQLEARTKSPSPVGEQKDTVPAKDKNPDDLEIP